MEGADNQQDNKTMKFKKVRFFSYPKKEKVAKVSEKVPAMMTAAAAFNSMSMLAKYTGSCHCGAVKFEVAAPRRLPVFDCNCSVCSKKQGKQFLVPYARFQLLTGHNELTTYTFGTHQAKHMFCSKCGVQSFFIPRSNPNAIAVMPHCLDGPLPLKIDMEQFDGQNWEQAIKKSHLPDASLH